MSGLADLAGSCLRGRLRGALAFGLTRRFVVIALKVSCFLNTRLTRRLKFLLSLGGNLTRPSATGFRVFNVGGRETEQVEYAC